MEYLIIFCIGLLATTIGTIAGSGGLISLPAMLTLGMPVHSAIGANKVSNTFSSFSSFYLVYRLKKITFHEAFKIVPISIVGGVTGGLVATSISENMMYRVAIGLLLFAFIASFFGKGSFTEDTKFKLNKKRFSILYAIGIYDGMFGPGQGTLMMHYFSFIKISYMKSIGLARAATFSSCFGAALSYIAAGDILWGLTICLLFGSLTGAQVGVRLASRIKKEQVKPILRIVTAAFIVYLLFTL
nr:sulfite exporter TauE/SafE family protein [Halalkalibacillus halophilus]